MGKKYGFSFSPSRALGISSAKTSISKSIGIPITKQGRQRKVGKMMGCSVSLFFLIAIPLIGGYLVLKVLL